MAAYTPPSTRANRRSWVSPLRRCRTRLVVSLFQHKGSPAKPVVAVGEQVLKGQRIGAAEGMISSSVHAPSSGRITAIEMHPAPHHSGLPDLSIILETDGEERWIERQPMDYCAIDPSGLRQHLQDMGVVGLGGAAFPSHVKLNANHLETLVINAAECEPYITCDDMLMRERAAEVVQGIMIAQHAMGARNVLIGIEDNKPQAIACDAGGVPGNWNGSGGGADALSQRQHQAADQASDRQGSAQRRPAYPDRRAMLQRRHGYTPCIAWPIMENR